MSANLRQAVDSGDAVTVSAALALLTDEQQRHTILSAADALGQTVLHLAAYSGHTEIVVALIAAGANVNAQTRAGHTPLHLASQEGHTAICKALLQAGANVDTRNNSGRTPLHAACMAGRGLVVDALLQAHANVELVDSDGKKPIEWAQAKHFAECLELLEDQTQKQISVHDAATHGDVAALREAIDRGGDVNLRDKLNQTPLHGAAFHGQVACVQLLLQRGANVLAASNSGHTPLHLASQERHFECVKLLVNSESIRVQTQRGRTALFAACSAGDFAIAKVLIAYGSDILVADRDGLTPLHAAAGRGHADVCALLLDAASSSLLMTDAQGRNALHAAAAGGHAMAAAVLIDRVHAKYGQDSLNTLLIQQDENELRPIDLAEAYCKTGPAAAAPLEVGAVQLTEVDEQSSLLHMSSRSNMTLAPTASSVSCLAVIEQALSHFDPSQYLHIGASSGDIASVNILLASASPSYVDDRSALGTAALHLAAANGDIAMTRLLIKYNADVNARDMTGALPLHVAAANGHADVADVLIGAGAEKNAVRVFPGCSCLKRTPLADACEVGAFDTASLLLLLGEDIHVVDWLRRTPLHLAAARGDVRVVELLLGEGVVQTAEDELGWTALHYAVARGNVDVIRALGVDGGRALQPNGIGICPLQLVNQGAALDMLLQVIGKYLVTATATAATFSETTELPPIASAAVTGSISQLTELFAKATVLDVVFALRAAVATGQAQSIRCLANVCHQTSPWRPISLFAAVCTPNMLSCVRALVQAGAPVTSTAAAPFGMMPLHVACAVDADSVVPFLLETGVLVTAEDRWNRTPAAIAAENYFDRTAELLSHEVQRTFVAFELLDTERSYTRSLHVVADVFMKPIRAASTTGLRPAMQATSVESVFAHWSSLTSLHDELLSRLSVRVSKEHWNSSTMVGDVMAGIIPYLRMYTAYVDAFDSAAAVVAKWKRSQRASQTIQLCEADPRCNSLQLQAFLIMPVQRVPRYRMLLRELQKFTRPGHPDEAPIAAALAEIDNVAQQCNESIRERETREKVAQIQASFDGAVLIVPGRRLLADIESSSPVDGTPRRVLVFSDAVVIGALSVQKLHRGSTASELSVAMSGRFSPTVDDGAMWSVSCELPIATAVVSVRGDTVSLRSGEHSVQVRSGSAVEIARVVNAAIDTRLHASVLYRDHRRAACLEAVQLAAALVLPITRVRDADALSAIHTELKAMLDVVNAVGTPVRGVVSPPQSPQPAPHQHQQPRSSPDQQHALYHALQHTGTDSHLRTRSTNLTVAESKRGSASLPVAAPLSHHQRHRSQLSTSSGSEGSTPPLRYSMSDSALESPPPPPSFLATRTAEETLPPLPMFTESPPKHSLPRFSAAADAVAAVVAPAASVQPSVQPQASVASGAVVVASGGGSPAGVRRYIAMPSATHSPVSPPVTPIQPSTAESPTTAAVAAMATTAIATESQRPRKRPPAFIFNANK